MAAMKYYGKMNEVPLLAVRLCDGYGLDAAVMAPLISWLIECYREGLINEAQTGLPLSKAGSAEFIEALTRKISFREGFGDVLAKGTLAAAATLGEKAKEFTDQIYRHPHQRDQRLRPPADSDDGPDARHRAETAHQPASRHQRQYPDFLVQLGERARRRLFLHR